MLLRRRRTPRWRNSRWPFRPASQSHRYRAGSVSMRLHSAGRSGERARALAPEVGDVYLTWCLLHSPVRLSECEAGGRHAWTWIQALRSCPASSAPYFTRPVGTTSRIELANQSLANDPYKPAKLARMVRMFERTGDRGGAERVYREAIRLWPDSGRFRPARLAGLAKQGIMTLSLHLPIRSLTRR